MPLPNLVAERYLELTDGGTSTAFYQYGFNERILPDGLLVQGADSLHRNLSLRNQLHVVWNTSPERRLEIATYYVKKWGGIGGNRATTLERYVGLLGAAEVPPNQGIASWSKIATISNPLRYAIFDARVSASLNCIQLLSGELEFAFPCLPTQNGLVGNFNTFWRANGHARALPLDRHFYDNYLTCIQQAAALAGTTIQHIEMMLFTIVLVDIPQAMGLQ